MITFRKYLKREKKGQAVLEYFILFMVIVLLTIFFMSPSSPLSIPKVKTDLEGAFNSALDDMGVK